MGVCDLEQQRREWVVLRRKLWITGNEKCAEEGGEERRREGVWVVGVEVVGVEALGGVVMVEVVVGRW